MDQKRFCDYLLVWELAKGHEQAMQPEKCCPNWLKGTASGLSVAIVSGSVVAFLCCKGGDCALKCTTCCLLVLCVPIVIVCLTYLASLCIKRMPDWDKRAEMRHRLVQFYLAEQNKKEEPQCATCNITIDKEQLQENHHAPSVSASCNITIDKEQLKEIKKAIDSVSAAICKASDEIVKALGAVSCIQTTQK